MICSSSSRNRVSTTAVRPRVVTTRPSITNDGPSTGVAYLLWFFLALFSAHRFYLGRPGSAVLQILSYFVLIGFLWVLIDAFLIPGMVRQKKQAMRERMTMEALSYSPGEQVSYERGCDVAPAVASPAAALPAK